ncbi:MAG TPA: hypothetical protein EYO60_05855 [Candidatus Lambdaproteobacteria bacterium]|nr:hypothetical protein [Deltaproteobacteria bacterium]HIB93809.1 hypothetical protein [Candidatus Lambdaproteobacteria bacterium]
MRLQQVSKYFLPIVFALIIPKLSFAHAGYRGHVLLLPTQLYIIGGAAVVTLTFVAMIFVFRKPISGQYLISKNSEIDIKPNYWMSFFSLQTLLLLVLLGFTGNRDPLRNLLPLTVWVIWWTGFTLLTAMFGNLWEKISPWYALQKLVFLFAGKRVDEKRSFGESERWTYWPATILFLGFAWFELVHPSPMDPALLAKMILLYLLVTIIGIKSVGIKYWLKTGEAFSVFFRMVSWLSPFYLKTAAENNLQRTAIRWPCAGLLRSEPLPTGGVAFVLLVLSTVSFDGLSKTFWWMSLTGINPLEFPGRTEMIWPNTFGLFATFLVFSAAFYITQKLASWLNPEVLHSSCFIYSLIPIAFGYHFAHYLPTFLVDIQYALIVLSDPFGLGWNLLGTVNWVVTSSFLANYDSAVLIWYMQVSGIVLAHVGAVIVAHLLQLHTTVNWDKTLQGQVPATVLMIAYTVFGLWLLSTPVIN